MCVLVSLVHSNIFLPAVRESSTPCTSSRSGSASTRITRGKYISRPLTGPIRDHLIPRPLPSGSCVPTQREHPLGYPRGSQNLQGTLPRTLVPGRGYLHPFTQVISRISLPCGYALPLLSIWTIQAVRAMAQPNSALWGWSQSIHGHLHRVTHTPVIPRHCCMC